MRKTFLPKTSKFFTVFLLSVIFVSYKAIALPPAYVWTGVVGDGLWSDPLNWTISGTVTAIYPGELDSTDNVEIPSAGVTYFPTLDNTALAPTIRNINISPGATLTIDGYGYLTTEGTLVDSGTVAVVNYGSIIYIAGNGGINYGTITVSNGGDIEDSANFTNNGIIDIEDNFSSQVLFDYNLVNNGTIMGTATDFSGAGGVVMTGYTSSAQSISGKGKITDLYIDSSGPTSVSNVTITSGDTLFLSGILSLNGNLKTNNVLVLTSDSSGTAVVGSAAGVPGSLSGNVTVQQYIPGGRRAYRFWGHPFSSSIPLSQIERYIDITGTGGAINGFTTSITNNPSAFWYNTALGNPSGSDPGWIAFTNTNGLDTNTFSANEGILLFMRGQKGQGLTSCFTCYTPKATTISMYGPLNQGNINVTLHKGANSDYNQISNPYPCPIDLNNAIATADTAGQIAGPAFYVWDPYMAVGGAFQAITIDTVAFTQYFFEACSSFQVRAAFDGAVLSFNEGIKTNNITTTLLRETKPNNPYHYVTLSIYDYTSRLWDMTHLKFNGEATDALDKYDATKPSNNDLNFYSISSDNQKLVIDGRPYMDGQVIPLGITTGLPQTFTMKVDDYSVPAGGELYLHDKYLNEYVSLENGTAYTFDITLDPASQGEHRFELVSGNATALNNVNNANEFETAIIPNPATEQVTVSFQAQTEGDATIAIKNIVGQQFYNKELGKQQSGKITVSLDNFPAGMYVAEIKCGDKYVTRKFIKQ